VTTRLNIALLALFLMAAIPFYWLFIDDPSGNAAAKPLTIGQPREAADAIQGEKAISIRYETASARQIPRIVLAAGQGTRATSVDMRSYKLDFTGQPPILIDHGTTLVEASGFRFERVEREALKRMDEMRGKARLVLTLGDGGDRSQDTRAAQCSRPKPIAAGVVEIPVCDDVLAKRMIYVRLEDGSEFLLVGDIAPTMANILTQSGPSRLLNDHFVKQDRRAIHSWLLTISQLRDQAPEMEIIPGHDQLTHEQMRPSFDDS